MCLTVELPWNFKGKAGAEAIYVIAKCSFTGINFETLIEVWVANL